MKRNLLSVENSDDFFISQKEDPIICINGYMIDSFVCNCYPGWTSKFNSFNQCDIDTGENLTKLNKDIESPNSSKNKNNKKNNNNIMAGIAIPFCLFLIILLIIFCLLRCLCKKFKKIKSIKNIIRSHKNKNKIKESETSLELSSDVDNKNNTKLSFNQSKQCLTIKKDEKVQNNNNSFNSHTKRIIDNSNYELNNNSV